MNTIININDDQVHNRIDNSMCTLKNSFHQNIKQKRNTIEISNFIFHNFLSYNDLTNKDMNCNCNNSFDIDISEVKNQKFKYKLGVKKDIILPKKITFIDISKKNVDIPLYNDNDIFDKEPYNNNLIIMNRDFDVESRENSIVIAQEYVLKELNYGILSYQQKQCNF